MPEASKKSRFIDIALIFAVVYLVSTFAVRWFFPPADPRGNGIFLTMEDASVRAGLHPVAVVENLTGKPLVIPARCPAPPLDTFRVTSSAQGSGTVAPLSSDQPPAVECPGDITVESGKKGKISLAPWKYSLFGEKTKYEVRLPAEVAAKAGTGSVTASARFDVYEPGAVVKLYRAIITKPFLNFLIFIASVAPGHSLAVAIIVLTLLVKLLLFFPTQKSLEGQKKMQLLQPKLEEVRKKYEGDATRQQQETMKLWKEHKINPFQSCLPLLLQFPILIGLFHVIRDGSTLALSRDLIYPIYQNLDWSFGTGFFGLDLTLPNYYFFPPLLVILQFLQMRLSFAISDRKKAKQIEKIEHGGVQTPEKTAQDIQQKMMMYVLPFMIGFFAIQFPVAVSLYWGISTLFGIGQQLIVNREHLRV